MNYRQQDRFFRRYRVAAALLTGAWLGAFAWSLAEDGRHLSRYAATLLGLLGVGIAYGLAYLPLYHMLSVDALKPRAWALRVRWVAYGLLALATAPLAARNDHLGLWAAGVGLGIAIQVGSRRVIRSGGRAAGDLWLVLWSVEFLYALVALRAADLPGTALVAGVGIAGLFVIGQSRGSRPDSPYLSVRTVVVVALAAATAAVPRLVPGDPPPFPLAAVLAIVAYLACLFVLSRIAYAHAQQSAEATIEELSEFANVPAPHAEELLVTSTGILARSWNADPPTRSADVERWYEENSRYYLYDLAQFHLAYKHIAFMRDVIAMCRGRVLDHGGGIGDVALELARRGHRVTYLDVDGETKAFARWKAGRDALDVEFASDVRRIEGPFDTIVSLDVLEHLPDPEPVVERLVALLAPGGRFIVTAYFGPTKAHPMHFDHRIDLAAVLEARGLRNAKSFPMRWLRSEFLGKRGVLVFERPAARGNG